MPHMILCVDAFLFVVVDGCELQLHTVSPLLSRVLELCYCVLLVV